MGVMFTNLANELGHHLVSSNFSARFFSMLRLHLLGFAELGLLASLLQQGAGLEERKGR